MVIGVTLGCILLPLLFNILLEWLPSHESWYCDLVLLLPLFFYRHLLAEVASSLGVWSSVCYISGQRNLFD